MNTLTLVSTTYRLDLDGKEYRIKITNVPNRPSRVDVWNVATHRTTYLEPTGRTYKRVVEAYGARIGAAIPPA